MIQWLNEYIMVFSELMLYVFDIPPRRLTEKIFDSSIVKTADKIRGQ